MTIYKSKQLEIYDNDQREFVRISEDGDGLGMMNVKAGSDFYGHIDFSMDVNMAIALAESIIEQANYIKEMHK